MYAYRVILDGFIKVDIQYFSQCWECAQLNKSLWELRSIGQGSGMCTVIRRYRVELSVRGKWWGVRYGDEVSASEGDIGSHPSLIMLSLGGNNTIKRATEKTITGGKSSTFLAVFILTVSLDRGSLLRESDRSHPSWRPLVRIHPSKFTWMIRPWGERRRHSWNSNLKCKILMNRWLWGDLLKSRNQQIAKSLKASKVQWKNSGRTRPQKWPYNNEWPRIKI